MAGIHYLSFIPAENPAHRSQGVNLLLMVDNQGGGRRRYGAFLRLRRL